jgi:phosphoserine aminotransferase
LHYTPNETLVGLAFPYVPKVSIPLIADMTSCLGAAPVDFNAFGAVYAATQKNLGIAGLCLLVIDKDLLHRARRDTPGVLDYSLQAQAHSLVNTPPVFSIYVTRLVVDWMREQGGLQALADSNQQKAQTLYTLFDQHPSFFELPVARSCRSLMNVFFRLHQRELEPLFLQEAKAQDLCFLKGHSAVGGIRASLYNALPLESVLRLKEFCQAFLLRHAK